jgi:hypothetical protein
MHRTQSKILRAVANAPWYVTNHTLHSDLKVPYVCDVIHERIGKHHTKLEDHPNPLLEPLLQPAYNRRLTDVGPSICQTPEVTSLDVHPNTSLYHDRTLA